MADRGVMSHNLPVLHMFKLMVIDISVGLASLGVCGRSTI
jgi:hypothetical protein